jgi:hypothetical protein
MQHGSRGLPKQLSNHVAMPRSWFGCAVDRVHVNEAESAIISIRGRMWVSQHLLRLLTWIGI